MKRVSVIGSGNWGSTIGKIVAENALKDPVFEKEVKMWVCEEVVDGKPLTTIINDTHINPKYLPGIKLPNNLIANPSLEETVLDSDFLIFIMPHQFLESILRKMKNSVKGDAVGISLLKGFIVPKPGEIMLASELISKELNIECGALIGANIAIEVAMESFCEATIGFKDKINGEKFKQIFQTSYFRITCTDDVAVCELCGALKNIVAVASGIADGLGFGDNTKAALIRISFIEIKAFILEFFSDKNPKETTLLESCGIADLITTCYGGRNRKIGEALAKEGGSLEELENKILNGQSAQGPITAEEVHGFLSHKNKLKDYPLLTGIHEICQGRVKPQKIIDFLMNHPCHK